MKRQITALGIVGISLLLTAVLVVHYGKPFVSGSVSNEPKQQTPTAAPSHHGASLAAQEAARYKVVESYGRLPLSFEANRGQADSRVKYLSRGNSSTLFLTSTEAVLALRSGAAAKLPDGSRRSLVLRMKLVGANPAPRIAGTDPLPGKSNYFTGKNPSNWHTDIPHFAKVKYEEIYPGVDLVYYGNQRQLEYDFVVAPGADPHHIALAVDGAEKVYVDSQGDLVLQAAGQEVHWRKPAMYQSLADGWREISGSYVEKANHVIGFAVGPYDASQPLVIDPVLSFSTPLGGNDNDRALGIALDAAGDVYVTGVTSSFGFPTTPGAFQTQFPSAGPLVEGEAEGGFVTKIKGDGSALVYSTYLAGGLPSGVGETATIGDGGSAIAVDSAGNAYVTGFTFNSGFPVTAGAAQTAFGGGICDQFNTACSDAFVTKLNPTGSGLLYSTFLGGNGADSGISIAVDAGGNAYVTGDTKSINFPTTAGAFQVGFGGGTEHVFVAKLNSAGSALAYSTYLGGNGVDHSGGIAVDSAGSAYLTGSTNSSTFPVMNAFQPSLGGGEDAFVTKLSATGSGLIYSTYLGGSDQDKGSGIDLDAAGNAYVTGQTFSGNFPLANPFQAARAGCVGPDDDCNDAFVTKLNAAGTALVYSTYLGGPFGDGGAAIAVDSAGKAFVTGGTGSPDFPTANPTQNAFGGGVDAFVTEFNEAGSTLAFSTLLGGASAEGSSSVAVDGAGNIYVTGHTFSSNFPVANPLQPTRASSDLSDAFVTKIGMGSPDFSLTAPSGTSATVAAGQTATYGLSLAGSNGFNGTVSFTCSDNAPAAACSVSPGSVMVSGTNPATATVSVTTTAPHAFVLPSPQLPTPPSLPSLPVTLLWLLVVLTLAMMLRSLQSKAHSRRPAWAALAGIVLFATLAFGCGGSNPPPAPTTQTLGTPSGVYTVTVTATSGAVSHSMNLSMTVQ